MKEKATEILKLFYNLINSPEFNDKFIEHIDWGYPNDTKEQIKERFKDITIWGDDFVKFVSEELESQDEDNIHELYDILSYKIDELHHDLSYVVNPVIFQRLIDIMNHETNGTHHVIGIRIYLVKDEDFHGDFYAEAFLDMDYNLFAFGFGD